MDERSERTRGAYDEVATEYATRISGELDGKPLDCALLDVFAREVGSGARVCDAGCGPGHVAAYLRDRGVDVVGVDISPSMVAEAARLHPHIEFGTGDLTNLPFEGGELAGAIAFYSIIHLQRENVTAALRSISERLRPHGLLFLSFHIGDHELHLDDWWGHAVNVDFTFFEVGEMKEYVRQAGYELVWIVEREPYAGVEHPSRRGYILARKPGAGSSDESPK